jgi:DNA-binding winged helix-turn-helix (wHTH) protein
MSKSPNHIASFGEFEFNLVQDTLRRGNSSVKLAPRRTAILKYFLTNPDRLISRQELQQKVLTDAFVADNSIDKHVSDLRRDLGQPPNGGEYISTVYGRGWQFVADITEKFDSSSAQPEKPEQNSRIEATGAKGALTGWRIARIAITAVLIFLLGGAVAVQAYGIAILGFALMGMMILVDQDGLRVNVLNRVWISVFFLAAMAYIPSAATEGEALEHVINAAVLKPAVLYLPVVGLRFVPMFVLVFAFWVVLGKEGDADFLHSRKLARAYLVIGAIFLVATLLASVNAFSDDLIRRSALPGSGLLLAGYLAIFAANVFVGLQGYRSLKSQPVSTFLPPFGSCLIAYLVIAVAAVAVDHQYNMVNLHYLDKRRPVAYVCRNPDAIEKWSARLDSLSGSIGPDFAALIRSADFQQALRTKRFYKQDHDEPFQVVQHTVMYGYRIDSGGGKGEPMFRTIRFPLEIPLSLRFEPAVE